MCKMLIKLFCLGFRACQNVESGAMKVHSFIHISHSFTFSTNQSWESTWCQRCSRHQENKTVSIHVELTYQQRRQKITDKHMGCLVA